MKSIAIFASGSGTNAENIIKQLHPQSIEVKAIYTNKPNAGVIERAHRFGIQSRVFNSTTDSDVVLNELLLQEIYAVVLAGYLKKIPQKWIQAFPDRIINIHPSLLPKYGGKGMFGDRVHQAVLDNQESESGITIHLVNEEYDKGAILFQKSIDISTLTTAKDIATAIHQLEYTHYPDVILKSLNA